MQLSGEPNPTPRRTRALVLSLALLVPLLSFVPWASGKLASERPHWVFLGFRTLALDHLQYMSFVAQSRESGSLLMENRFTNTPQRGRFLLLYLWFVGRVAHFGHIPDVTAWLCCQYVTGVGLLIAIWAVLGRLLADAGERLLAYGLACLASGLDWIPWLLVKAGVSAAEPFAWTFESRHNWSVSGALGLPMWGAAECIFLIAGILSLALPGRPRVIRSLLLGCAGPLAWAIHPYTGLFTFAVLAAIPFVEPVVSLARARRPDWSIVRDRVRLVLSGLASAPLIVAWLAWSGSDDAVREASAQALLPIRTESVGLYPIVYGLVLVAAWFGLRVLCKESGLRRDLLLGWTAAAFLLAINPWFSGYKFQYLLHLPLCILAARGGGWLHATVAWIRAAAGLSSVRIAAFLVITAGTLIAPFKDVGSVGTDVELFATQDELAAYDLLRGQPPGLVLATPEASIRIPWLGEHAVYVGHWFMTPDNNLRRRKAIRFFSADTTDEWRREFIAANRIAYVLADPRTASLGYQPHPDADLVGAVGEFQVFRVRGTEPP